MPILAKETSLFPDHLLEELPAAELGEDCPRRWFAVYTKSRQEKALARQLLGYQIPFYLPLVPQDNLIRGRKVRSFMPLFSNYLFLFSSDEERVQTLTTNRISRILEVEDPLQLQQDLRQVNELIARDAPITIEKQIQAGDRVRIRRGPLMGLEGTIVKRHGTSRLLVAVNYLQQGVSVQIDDFMVERL